MVDPYAIVRRLTGHELISQKDARLLTEAVDDLIDEIGSKDARIAELEAEVERLKIEIGECKLVIEQQDRDAEAAASHIATLKAENEQLRAQLVKATDPAYLEEKLRQIGITDEIAERALAERAGGVKVKALEWEKCQPGVYISSSHSAKTEIGEYLAQSRAVYFRGNLIASASGLDAAKAAAQADFERRILSALEAAPPAPMVTATHRHKKRGTEYVLLGFGKMQARDWVDHGPELDYDAASEEDCVLDLREVDMREVAIYRSIDDGSLWVRPREEFEDGRFEALTASEAK